IYLIERATIIASLVRRAASEVHIQRSSARAGVITRQIENQLLRRHGLWEKLEQPELEMVSVEDGLWATQQQNGIVEWCEQLRLLRWVLRLDAELMPLEHFPQPD